MKANKLDFNLNSDEYKALDNGCDLISNTDIESVRYDDFDFIGDESDKTIIYEMCCNVLRYSALYKKNYKYGEVLFVKRLSDKTYMTLDGNYHSIRLEPDNELFNESEDIDRIITFIVSSNDMDILCIHNHPDNSCFSWNDIYFFLIYDSISYMIVIGNTNNIFILYKTNTDNMLLDFLLNKFSYYCEKYGDDNGKLMMNNEVEKMCNNVSKFKFEDFGILYAVIER